MDETHKEMFKMWRSSWESYLKTLSMMQEQGDKMLDLWFTQSQTLQEENRRLIKEWMAGAQEARESYVKAMEDYFQKVEELLSKK